MMMSICPELRRRFRHCWKRTDVAIYSSASDESKRKMYNSVLLIGGGFMFTGAAAMLQSRLQAKLPLAFRKLVDQVEVIAKPKVCTLIVFLRNWSMHTQFACYWFDWLELRDVSSKWIHWGATDLVHWSESILFLGSAFSQNIPFFFLICIDQKSSLLGLPMKWIPRQSAVHIVFWGLIRIQSFFLEVHPAKMYSITDLLHCLEFNLVSWKWIQQQSALLRISFFICVDPNSNLFLGNWSIINLHFCSFVTSIGIWSCFLEVIRIRFRFIADWLHSCFWEVDPPTISRTSLSQ